MEAPAAKQKGSPQFLDHKRLKGSAGLPLEKIPERASADAELFPAQYPSADESTACRGVQPYTDDMEPSVRLRRVVGLEMLIVDFVRERIRAVLGIETV